MSFNPLDPSTLRALQALRTKHSARIDLMEMTYTIPFLETRCLTRYLEEQSGLRTRYEEHEVLEALRATTKTQYAIAKELGTSRAQVHKWFHGHFRIPFDRYVPLMRILEA